MVIELTIDKTINSLAGHNYGHQIFTEQVKGKFDYLEMNIIKFPNHINRIAISFIQGFIEDILITIPKSEIMKHLSVQMSSPYLEQKFYSNVVF